MSNKLTVVMYHYVRDIKNSRYPNIKGLELSQFVEQLKYLNKHYNIIGMEDVLASKYHQEVLPDKAVLLTFDDAYAEHFNFVYPILKKMKMKGAFYVPAKTVQEHKVLDVNKIHFILSNENNTLKIINHIRVEIDKYREEFALSSFDFYYKKYAVENRFDNKNTIFIKRVLQHALPERLRNIISDNLFEQHVGVSEEAFSRELYMNKYQLEQLVNDGMHIGSHGYDHYWWNKLDNEQLSSEIDRSIQFLSSLGVDTENWTACYPYGSYSEQVVMKLRDKGCKLAFTTEVDIANLNCIEPLLIPRLDTNDLPKSSSSKPNEWHQKV
ncbi:polysaccharide deacetylase family protein [Vibrio sp. SCSIO 43137]|uniref:polysaccharide deacetylase family protein n=1 Tax=Vibrio sp. SCSIO 43137 TaxID=3021011 RepID=UPI002307DAA5|nr:polysaccharide deacetylase family protein [Vibrio sp. SCSIO 43137]WCE29856.1 polysaccharide deacetylase family protein [Vibrio sp. SCSIO 43137]